MTNVLSLQSLPAEPNRSALMAHDDVSIESTGCDWSIYSLFCAR